MKLTIDFKDERNKINAGIPKTEVFKDILKDYIYGNIPESIILTDRIFMPLTREEIHTAFRMLDFEPYDPEGLILYDDGTFSDTFVFNEDSPLAEDEMYGCTSETCLDIDGDTQDNSFQIHFTNGALRPEREY